MSSPFCMPVALSCLIIVGLLRVRSHLSERMRVAALCHTKIVGDLVVLQVAVTSTTESVLVRSPYETFWVEAVGELFAEFRRLEEMCSWLKRPGVRIYDLLLGVPLNQV
jgi:hypothetical protein